MTGCVLIINFVDIEFVVNNNKNNIGKFRYIHIHPYIYFIIILYF